MAVGTDGVKKAALSGAVYQHQRRGGTRGLGPVDATGVYPMSLEFLDGEVTEAVLPHAAHDRHIHAQLCQAAAAIGGVAPQPHADLVNQQQSSLGR